ncbi:MAG: CBS domain-containing protein [Aphanocapsa sp. GSE-SYN-MK-11-07L]|jgi:tRNA nucleotidyltransferase (CCA-adding enzyme)|nr:CBS domain-containing protein [Aphanocapsa sp. GSE-SYN-MK-11-07L]
MNLILCHRTADFDTLGAAVGLARLQPGTRIVLSGGAHPGVRSFLALYRDEYPLIERRSVQAPKIRAIAVVDTQRRELLGPTAKWLDLEGVAIAVYDHHMDAERDIAASQVQIEAVGATTTLIAEHLQQHQIDLTAAEATVMALGIHVDTGSLTFEQTTVRDAAALTWLIGQGANQRAIAEYIQPGLPENLQHLLKLGLETLDTETVHGYKIAAVLLTTPGYTPGMSTLAAHLIDLTESDALLLGNVYAARPTRTEKLTIIGRSRIEGVDLNALLTPLGGGGHAQAAAATLKTAAPNQVLGQLIAQLKQQIPHPPIAQELMSAPVRTIRPETTVDQARRILLRYGHSGLSVVDASGQLLGIISRRDLDVALHHGFAHAPVKGYMTAPVRTIAPQTPLSEIESLMVTYDIGRLPVLDHGQLVGIVTRTDVLRQLYRLKQPSSVAIAAAPAATPAQLQAHLSEPHQQLLQTAAQLATEQGWQLYLVGGTVRDLLLAGAAAQIREFDLVVDGAQNLPAEGPGAVLARSLQQHYPEAQLQIYGQFQTAALHWGTADPLPGFAVDIATARTEFYPYPAAHPEVTASSIRQDLYRRDFTINALAVRLTPPRAGELLDFFGGRMDLELQQIRVLHPNSFIEDPTRIFRAVRFAIRLGFRLDAQTETYIRHAIASGIYQRTQTEVNRTPSLQSRLKNELKAIFQLPLAGQFPGEAALKLLADLGAFACIHPNFAPAPSLWATLAIAWQWYEQFGTTAIKAWEFLTEVLLAALTAGDRATTAAHLHLAQTSQTRLQHLAVAQAAIATDLPAAVQPSQISLILDKYDLPMLLLIATQTLPELRSLIWQYLDDWSQVKPPLDGNDLLRLGYKPGRQFRNMLEHLRLATVDGLITGDQTSALADRLQAEAFIQRHYPQKD